MLIAVFSSQSITSPQSGHLCILTDRDFLTNAPDCEHSCDVFLGHTSSTNLATLSVLHIVNWTSVP